MKLTLKQAAEATGLSKPTVFRAVQSGKISGIKRETDGAWLIDASELYRIYKPISEKRNDNTPMNQGVTHCDAVEIGVLRAENALLKVQLEREKETIDDLRRRLDMEAEERRHTQAQLAGLLTDQRDQAAPALRRWRFWR